MHSQHDSTAFSRQEHSILHTVHAVPNIARRIYACFKICTADPAGDNIHTKMHFPEPCQ